MSFIEWVRQEINPQAINERISIDDFSKDGTEEYYYPKIFEVQNDKYMWDILRFPTRGRSCSTHTTIYFSGKCFNQTNSKMGTGELTKAKIHKGLRIIYDFYYGQGESLA